MSHNTTQCSTKMDCDILRHHSAGDLNVYVNGGLVFVCLCAMVRQHLSFKMIILLKKCKLLSNVIQIFTVKHRG